LLLVGYLKTNVENDAQNHELKKIKSFSKVFRVVEEEL
jgi:hypothetical protein